MALAAFLRNLNQATSFAHIASSLSVFDKIPTHVNTSHQQEWKDLCEQLLTHLKTTASKFIESEISCDSNLTRTFSMAECGLSVISDDLLVHCIGFVGLVNEVSRMMIVSKRFKGCRFVFLEPIALCLFDH